MKNKCLLIILLALLSFRVFSQSSPSTNYGLPKPSEYDRWSVGISFGASHLSGDLLKGDQNNNRLLQDAFIRPSFGLQLHYQLTHSIGIRGRAIASHFTATDEEYLDSLTYLPIQFPGGNNSKLYNDRLESPLLEGSLEMTYNFGNISFLNRNKKFHFVATLGVGMFNFDAKVKDEATGTVLRKSNNVTELMLPVSLGFKYKINKFDVGLAFEYRQTFTDNVDATVKTYSSYDAYYMVNAGVNYTFGKKNKAMEWVNPMEVVYNDLADMKEKIDIISGDKDKDGVSDLFDKDNNTPEGTKVYGDGTPVDTDGDGVPDNKDADPFTPKGAKVDANGQETDTDGDGVPDSRDLEPGTAQGSLVNFQGITLAKPGEYGKDGIAASGENGNGGANGLNGKNGTGYLPSIFFDLSSAVIKPVYHDRLLTIAKVMKANPSLNIMLTGNCDIKGSEEGNKKLGQKRADAVKEHLIKVYGIEGSRISTETKGKNEPLANKLNSMNRRVDFSIK